MPVLGHVPVRHMLEHVPGHMLEHVPKHVPDRHVLNRHVPEHVLGLIFFFLNFTLILKLFSLFSRTACAIWYCAAAKAHHRNSVH